MYVFVASLLGLLLQLPPENEDDDDGDGDGDGDGAVLRYASMFVREREGECVCVRLLSLGVCHKEVSRSRVRWSRVW